MLFRKSIALPDYVRLSRKAVKYARLRINSDASVALTVPQWYRSEDIADLLQRKADWINAKRQQCRERLATARVFEPHQVLWQDRLYHLQQHEQRQDRFVDAPEATLFTRQPLHEPQARLAWYRKQSRRHLDQRLQQLSIQHGLPYQRISVRDQKTRWGSCSSKGTISLNWRLVLAPESVAEYVMLHELAHTQHMNHSAAFWQLVERLCPEHISARAWLKTKGQGLMDYL